MATRAQQGLIQQLGHSATTTDIAEYLDRDEREISSAINAVRAHSTESLNTLVNMDSGRVELAELIGSRDQRIESLGNGDALHRFPSACS